MDKFEYQAKLEELNKLVEKEDYEEAAALADTIEWKRVRSVRTLCMVSEIYEAVGRVEDSKSILYRAYRRSPNSRQILYRLTEVCVETGEFDDAVEYYTEYVNLAPNDNSKYILKYEIYKGRGSSIEEQIQVLEELKSKEYTEQWAYELARLYDEAGMEEKCVEACDDLALWFHNGQYVVQALELKKKYAPLTPEQQTVYDNPSGIVDMETKEAAIEAAVPTLDEEITKELPQSETEVIADSILMNTEKEIAAAVAEQKDETEQMTEAAQEPASGEQPAPQRPHTLAKDFDTVGLQNELANSMRQILAGMKPVKRTEAESLERVPELDMVAAAREQGADDMIEGQMSLDDFLKPDGVGAAVSNKQTPDMTPVRSEARTSDEPVQRKPQILDEQMARTEQDILSRPTIDISKQIQQETKGQDLRSYAAEQAVKARTAVPVQPAKSMQPSRQSVEQPQMRGGRTQAEAYEQERPVQPMRQEQLQPQSGSAQAETYEQERPVQSGVQPMRQEQLQPQSGSAQAETYEQGRPVQSGAQPMKQEQLQEPELSEEEQALDARRLLEEEILQAEADEQEPETEQPMEEEEPPMQEAQPEQDSDAPIDPMSYVRYGLDEKEKSMLGFWSTIRGMNEQVNAAVTQMMRNILADKTSSRGNVILVGDAGNGRTTLALSIAKILGRCKGQQSAKAAKIYAEDLNSKDIAATVSKIAGGVLIIEEAGDLADNTIAQLSMAMDFKTDGLIVFLEDERRYLQDLLARNPQFAQKFDITINVPMLTNDELVEFGKYYALQNDCVLDDSAILTLYDGIGVMQTPEQPVAILDVKEVMDKAIRRANKFSLGKIFSTITGKRYDAEDRIIIKGKNFKKIK